MTLDIDEWVVLATIAAVGLLIVLVPAGYLEVFLVLVLVSMLIVRTLVGLSASDIVTASLDGFIVAGLFVFAAIMVRRVFGILGAAQSSTVITLRRLVHLSY